MVEAPQERCRRLRDPQPNALHHAKRVSEDELDLELAGEEAHEVGDAFKVVVGVVGESSDLAFWCAKVVLVHELGEDGEGVADGLVRARIVDVDCCVRGCRIDESRLRRASARSEGSFSKKRALTSQVAATSP